MFSHTRIQDTTTRTYIHVTNIVFEHADERWPWIWIIAFVIVRYWIHIFVAYYGKDDFKLKLRTIACNCLIGRCCICSKNAFYVEINVFMFSYRYKQGRRINLGNCSCIKTLLISFSYKNSQTSMYALHILSYLNEVFPFMFYFLFISKSTNPY